MRWNPLLKIIVLRLELKIKMLGILHYRRSAASSALRRAKLLCAIRRTAVITTVAVLILRAALGTSALNEAIGQKHCAMLAIKLRRSLFRYAARLLHLAKDKLGKRLVLRRICRIVIIEGNLEISKILKMNTVHTRNKLFGRNALLARTNHDGSAMRIVSTNIHTIIAAQLLEPDPKIGLQIFDQVPKMNIPVCIGERARNDNFSFAHLSGIISKMRRPVRYLRKIKKPKDLPFDTSNW